MNDSTDIATLRTQRVFAASPARLYAAFSDPVMLAQWWGPAGFRNTFEVFEFREGGRWKFVMHGPDGTDYANECEFVELREPERVVICHVCAPLFTLTVDIAPEGEGARLQWAQRFDDAVVAQSLRAICEPANEQNLDRLQKLLGV